MSNTVLNPIAVKQRKLLAFGVVLMLAVFLIWYFFFMNKKITDEQSINTTVYLRDSKLHIFDDVYTLKQYPDKILLHYPYLLIIQADKPLTIIYNLETKQKEKEIKEVLLDYYKGNIVYNKKQSFYNNINLDEYCDSAFIKSEKEILCIVRSNQDSHNNMLISIPPDRPNLWKSVYQSPDYNILTAVSVINNNLCVGEIDFDTKKSYLTINKQTFPVNNIVSLIYEMDGQPYFASFKSALNNQEESYSFIDKTSSREEEKGKILLYRQ